MSVYVFGHGWGQLSQAVAEAARREGAELVNRQGIECRCGGKCAVWTCPKATRHFFSIPDKGEAANRGKAFVVLAAALRAATPEDRVLLMAPKERPAAIP